MRTMRLLVLAAMLSACSASADEDMWECQLSVQKGNAGRDVAAAAERMRDIEVCMDQRGYRLDVRTAACREGSANSGCYLPK